MKIIGLTGAAGAGKDTVAEIALQWCAEKDIKAERVAFADPLKISAAACFGIPASKALEFCNWLKQPGVFVIAERLEGEGDIPAEIVEASGIKGKSVSGRQFLQFFGTEGHRDVFGSEFWVNATMHPLDERFRELRAPDVVFITDPRFPNEAAAIHERGGEVWEIVRPGQSKVEAHASEAGLPEAEIDFGIRNVGTLDDLTDKVRLICEQKLEGAK